MHKTTITTTTKERKKKNWKMKGEKNKNKTKNDFCHSLVKSLSPSTKSLKSLSKREKERKRRKEKEGKKRRRKNILKKKKKEKTFSLSLVKSLSPSYIPSSKSVHSKLPPNHFRECLPLGLRMVTPLSSGSEVGFSNYSDLHSLSSSQSCWLRRSSHCAANVRTLQKPRQQKTIQDKFHIRD